MQSLERFLTAQRQIYPQVVAELRSGAKQTHWMWFIFPQIAGLGRSETARYYAIADLAEAKAYLDHPLLRERLADCTDTMIGWSGRKTAETILGEIDAVKFASSMTLFEAAGGGPRFGQALSAFYGGDRDAATLSLIGDAGAPPGRARANHGARRS